AEEERIRKTLRALHGRAPELPEDTTWAGLFERVMGGERGDLKPRTLETYREIDAQHLRPVFGATVVRELTRLQLLEFLRARLTPAERQATGWAPLWTVQTLTGLRPGEVYALEEADLDLEHRILRVERTLSDDGERVDTPKGGAGRKVDLSNEAVRVLRAHLV